MEELIWEYENMLIGNLSEISIDCFIGIDPGGQNERLAIECIRYVLERIMDWNTDTAIQRFDSYIIHILKLDGLLRYIDFPPDFEYGSPKYILSLLYPNKIKFNQRELVMNTYNEVLDGTRNQFPRDYFLGRDGFKRYCYCMKFVLEICKPFTDVSEVYEYFSSPKGNTLLSEYKLRIPTYQYSLDPIQAIHEITKDKPDGELFYLLYQFNKEYSEICQTNK